MNNFSLLGKGGEKNDCLFTLPDRPVGIGTDPDKCTIVYSKNNADISEFHCQLVPNQGGWTITDYSGKGTWLNGKKMIQFKAYPLKPGDVIYLARLENSFYFSDANFANQGQNQPPPQGQPPPTQWQNPNQGQPPPQEPKNWKAFLKKHFHTDGRLNRKPYIMRSCWVFFINMVVSTVLLMLIKSFDEIQEPSASVAVMSLVLYILVMAINIALAAYVIALGIRRLHDTDNAGWWLLAGAIPFVNFYVMYLLWIKKGTAGPNRFGDDPLA